MIPALPGILTTKQKKSRPGSPSWAAAYFHISIIPSILKHRQDGDDNKTPVAGGRPQKNTRPAALCVGAGQRAARCDISPQPNRV